MHSALPGHIYIKRVDEEKCCMCAPAVVKLSGSKSEALPAVTEVSERGTKLPQRIREAADIVGEPRVMVRR